MSDNRLFLKPVAGVPVLMADGTFWPEAGAFADMGDLFHRRRLADGDLVEAEPPQLDPPEVSRVKSGTAGPAAPASKS